MRMMKVNEIFYSLQGEGHFTGTPAVFIRLSGCNLKCDFCDTSHREGTEMSEDEIITQVRKYQARHIVITGGEPTLQLTATLVEAMHREKRFVQIETNGTVKLDPQLLSLIDWITCSPKFGILPNIQRIDELKVVFDYLHPEQIGKLDAVTTTHRDTYYLQPCDRTNLDYNTRNIAACVSYILQHPKWKLSLQTHKLLGIR